MVVAKPRLGQFRSRDARRDLHAAEKQRVITGGGLVCGRGSGQSRKEESSQQAWPCQSGGKWPAKVSRLHRTRLLSRPTASRSGGSRKAVEALPSLTHCFALMQLHIVHDDAEIGEQLVQMVKDLIEEVPHYKQQKLAQERRQRA